MSYAFFISGYDRHRRAKWLQTQVQELRLINALLYWKIKIN